MPTVLIVYGSRRGATTDTANTLADVLKNEYSCKIELCDSKHIKIYKKRIQEFDAIIIGSSIMSGWWKSRVLSFTKKDIFSGKKVAVFVTAGGTLNKVQKYGILKEEAVNEAILKYIDKYSNKFKFTPIHKTAFGGRVVRRNIVIFDNWNKDDIICWAKKLGETF